MGRHEVILAHIGPHVVTYIGTGDLYATICSCGWTGHYWSKRSLAKKEFFKHKAGKK